MISEHIERGSFRTALRFGLKRYTHKKRELTLTQDQIHVQLQEDYQKTSSLQSPSKPTNKETL